MELADLLNNLQKRAPWLAVGRPILLQAGFVIHRGYELTIRSALSEPADEERTDRLDTAVREHIVAGEKLIRVVKIKPKERDHLSAWIASKRKSSNALTNAYPGVASDADIKALQSAAPASVGHIQLQVGSAALFTSSRWYLDKITIPKNKLKAGEAEGYEEIFAIRRNFVQAYDAVWLPEKGNIVCLVTDLPVGAPSGFARDGQLALEFLVRKELGRSIQAVNLLPAVTGLYEARDGNLVDYGFVNNVDAVKHHAGRRRGKSLWDDLYDKAGAEAVGDDLRIFKIAIAWAREKGPAKAQPEILLPGTFRLLAPNSRLDHAIVRNCLNTRDLSFVLSRLLAHI